MADKTKDIALNIYLNPSDATKGITKLRKEFNQLQKDIEKLTPGTEEYIAATKRLGELDKTFENQSKTIRGLRSEATKLRNVINNGLIPGTKEYNAAVKQLQGLNSQIQAHTNKINNVGGAWDTVKKGMLGVIPSIVAFAGVDALFSGASNMLKHNADLSDSFGDVRKTTGMTNDEVNDLNNSFKNFNTRTPRKELLDLSIVAGKLGIKGVADVSKFVKAADMINVALGEDLGDIDTVVRNLGALNNLFNLDKLYGTADAMLKVGSAINSVGAAGTARESALVDFSSRVGGAANSVGLLIDQVIGYGAILDEAMVSSETSSTAISQFWVKMGQDAEKFAGIAGMEVDAFRKLMAEDFNEAFIKVLEGLKSTGGGIEELASSMAGAGVDSSRMIQSLQALANNTDKLREKQKLSAEEFKKGSSLMDEFAVKNDNLAAKLERLNKWFTGNFVSGGIMKAFETLVDLADKYVQVPLSQTLEKERIGLNSLVSMLIEHNDNQKRRNEIIAQIQSRYPDFLKNMDVEKVTTEQLSTALAAYNAQMLKKITLQAYEEKLADAVKRKIDLEDKRDKVEEEANNKAFEAGKLLNVQLSETMSLEEKYQLLREKRNKMIAAAGDKGEARRLAEIDKMLNSIGSTLNDVVLTNLGDFANLIAKEEADIQKLMDKINGAQLDAGTNAPNAPAGSPTAIGPVELSDEQKKAIQERIDANRKMLQELEELNISMIEDDYERELTQLHQKQVLRKQDVIDSKADAETKKAMLLAIEQEFMLNANDLRNRYYEIQKKEGETDLIEREKQLKDEQDIQYRNEVAGLQMRMALSKEGTKERLEAEKELLLLQMRWEINQMKLTEKEKELLKAETLQKIAELEEIYRKQQVQEEEKNAEEANQVREERLQLAFDSMQTMLQAMQDIFTLVYDIRKQEIEDERAALEEKFNLQEQYKADEKARNQEAYEDDRISKQELDQYNRDIDIRYTNDRQKQEEELDRKAAKIEKEAAKRKKALAIVQAIIAGAQAAMQGIAQFGPPPSPAGIAALAAAAVTTAVQIAVISKTKFAKGGSTMPMNTFAGGGPVSNTKIGMIGEEGPEWVAPNWMLRNPETANIIGMLEDMRINRQYYATGGATASKTQTSMPSFSAPTIAAATADPEMKMLLNKLLAKLDEPLKANAIIGNRQIEELEQASKRLGDSKQKGRTD